MEKETYDTLYNKEAKDLTYDDAKYINRLLGKKQNEFMSLFSLTGIPLVGPLFGLLISIGAGAGLFGIIMAISSGFSISLGLIFAAAFKFCQSPLSYYGLTKAEWKELKKSGRLKELYKILKTYQNKDFSKEDYLNNAKLNYEEQLEKVEEEKRNLFAKLAEINKQIESNKEVKTDETPMLRKQIKNNSNIENKENEVVIENKEENTNSL